VTGNFHKITYLEGTEHQQHHTGGKITECPLKSQADGDAHSTNDGSKTGGLDAKNTKASESKKDQNTPAGKVGHKTGQRLIDTGFPHRYSHQTTRKTRNDPTHNQEEHYPDDLTAKIH
jgi:hypothetical protein